ncbi:MAG: DUF5597 domain-containing protein [Bacteroidales bacterium]|nr:DUF5597 domain-containing protein [Bacteroidales bacterium]
MKTFASILSAALLLWSAAACSPAGEQSAPVSDPPHLEKRGEATQLIVKGKPFLALSGELAGSSATSALYMEQFWPKFREAGLNTLLATVYWEQLEPEEGKYDFSRVDDMIRQARANDMHLVFLWFASWKNGITSHIPLWMKENQQKYALAETAAGKSVSILSTFCEANRDADARAFAALLGHIREVDAAQQTVLMIQIENEMGLHGDTRDHCAAAEKAFSGPVPAALTEYLVKNRETLLPETRTAWEKAGARTSGNWEEIFGKGDYTDELFMAWHYASYIEKVAAAGKAAYPIPFFVNAWLVQPEDRHPGTYPSGGPQAQNHDLWRAAAPSVDILSPDMYLADFPGILRRYMRGGNPGFIPESRDGLKGASNAAFLFGEMRGIGYSPMGVERLIQRENFAPLTDFYRTVERMMDPITEHQAAGTIRASWLNGDDPAASYKAGDYIPIITSETLQMGGYDICIQLNQAVSRFSQSPLYCGYAMVMQESDNEFTVIGSNVSVAFKPSDGKGFTGLGRVAEMVWHDGAWEVSRWLNGDDVQLRYDILQSIDEGFSSQGLRFSGASPQVIRVRLYHYD